MLSDASVMPTVPVSDLGRAKEFYSGKLGLKTAKDWDGGAMFAGGGGTVFSIYVSAGAGTSQATYASWKVDDIEAAMKELRDKGVEFEDYDMPGLKTENGIAVNGDDKAAWFKDPDGNILCLNQMD